MQPLKDKLLKQNKIRFLILRLKPIGDSILISAVFRNIKKLYPQAVIDIIVYPFAYDAVKNNPYLDNIIVLKRDNLHKLLFYVKSFFKSYDIIIDYINNPTSTIIALCTRAKYRIGNKTRRNSFYNYRRTGGSRHYSAIRCLELLKPLGLADYSDYMPEFYPDSKDIKAVEKMFKKNKIKNPMVGLFVSAKYPSRQYPAGSFAQLGRMIASKTKYSAVFLFGKGDEESYTVIKRETGNNKNIHLLSTDISIGELASAIKKCKILITNDTGPKHIATGLKVPTFTIYTATDDKVWNPPDKKIAPFIRAKIDCSPCNTTKCPKKQMDCVIKLKPEKIFNECKQMLSV